MPDSTSIPNLSANEVQQLIRGGESHTVEFKSRLDSPQDLARHIAGLANAGGGAILVGVGEPDSVIGCHPEQLHKVYQQALALLQPSPATGFTAVPLVDKLVGVVQVQPADHLILTPTGAFQRVGTATQAMSAGSITQALAAGRATSRREIVPVAETLEKLTRLVEDLQKQAGESHSTIAAIQVQSIKSSGFWAKTENYVVGGVIGAILGWLLPILFAMVFR